MRLKRQTMAERRVVRTGIITPDDIRKKFNLPKHAEITVRVPGGGDWSGMDAEIGNEIPHIHVKVESFE